MAYQNFSKFLESLSAGDHQSIDIICEVVCGKDGQKYWIPKQRAMLAKFFNVSSIYKAYGFYIPEIEISILESKTNSFEASTDLTLPTLVIDKCTFKKCRNER